MYIVDFVKKLGRVSNIPVIIYLVLNVALITLFLTLFELVWWEALLWGLAIYAVSVTIALSPVGEWLLRKQNGCKDIQDPMVQNKLYPLFREVYSRAKAVDPTLPNDIKLYIKDDDDPNAFATGRKTICVTRGLMDLPDSMIQATLAHEFGHLSHKDTDLILVVTVGNMFVSAIIIFFDVCIRIGHVIMELIANIVGGNGGCLLSVSNSISLFLSTLLVTGVNWLWTKIGTLLVMKSSRSNEFEADAFALNLGYGTELCGLLDTIGHSEASGLFANLASSHPSKEKRISNLRQLGARY